ncbi:hypothetical protein M0G74_05090 [Microbulbifer sp. CAU 1566]|uniref:hypothetical protein n=1 Tax=Microbulbifer sp. CAU 1566 TaxID=2933269 RepID=UPI002006070C|nr:hypothetical protein [Microbulbifer sp. CAU 1566]MCK7596647.1 hypothetical protein [Microbulbifer sp. CAU 1566]
MRKFIVTGLVIILAVAAAACDRQVCYREGRDNTPPIPFAQIGGDFSPALSLVINY